MKEGRGNVSPYCYERWDLLEECIAAVATPIAQSGICVIRLSGEGASAIASKVFVPVKNQSFAIL